VGVNEYVVGLFLIVAVVFTQCQGNNGKTLLDVVTESKTCAQK